MPPLLLALVACGGKAPELPLPPFQDAAQTIQSLHPRGPEKLVIANFWATW